MIFTENKQLFGFDPMERIVAVEFSPSGKAEIFMRGTDGLTIVQSEPFSPFLWATSSGTQLDGALKLDQLVTFRDWRSYQEARSRLAKEGTPFFASNDPVQQYLTFCGRTLFKGMRFEDLRRLQIDVETAVCPKAMNFPVRTRNAIIAVALSDDTGWQEIIVVRADS